MAEPRKTDPAVRPSREDYPRWLRRTFSSPELRRGRVHYDVVARQIRDLFSASAYWEELNRRMADWAGAYNVETGEVLLSAAPRPLSAKSWVAAFQWLRAQMDVSGEVLPRSNLAERMGFMGRTTDRERPVGGYS